MEYPFYGVFIKEIKKVAYDNYTYNLATINHPIISIEPGNLDFLEGMYIKFEGVKEAVFTNETIYFAKDAKEMNNLVQSGVLTY